MPLGSAWRSLAAVGATRRRRDAARDRSLPRRIHEGYSVLFVTAPALVAALAKAHAEGRLEERLGFFAGPIPAHRRASVLPTGVAAAPFTPSAHAVNPTVATDEERPLRFEQRTGSENLEKNNKPDRPSQAIPKRDNRDGRSEFGIPRNRIPTLGARAAPPATASA